MTNEQHEMAEKAAAYRRTPGYKISFEIALAHDCKMNEITDLVIDNASGMVDFKVNDLPYYAKLQKNGVSIRKNTIRQNRF